MAVQIRLKGDRVRIVEFPDDQIFYFTARDFPDGRVEVTKTQRGSSDPGVVVAEFAMQEIEFIDNGWRTE